MSIYLNYRFAVLAIVVCGCFVGGCGHRGRGDSEVGVPAASKAVVEANDVAMMISSMVDAVNMHECIEGDVYDYSGILTDGQGMPLYTTLSGAPGEWVVDVDDTGVAVVRNEDLGDLLSDDLRYYIVSTLRLDDSDVVEMGMIGDDAGAEVVSYDFGEGLLKFESRYEQAVNGREGVWMSIYVIPR